MVMLQEVACLMEGEWSCYRGGQFIRRENGHFTIRGGQFNGGRIV